MTGLLYFLSRLDSLNDLFSIVLTFSVIGLIVSITAQYVVTDDRDRDGYEELQRSFRRARRVSIVIIVVFSVLKTATPRTRDAYIIFGVGETLEYLKENNTARQLPGKAIRALDAWMETMASDSTKQEEHKTDRQGVKLPRSLYGTPPLD